MGWPAIAHDMNTCMLHGPMRRHLRSWSAGATLVPSPGLPGLCRQRRLGQRTLQRKHAAAELGAQRQVHSGARAGRDGDSVVAQERYVVRQSVSG